MPPGASPIVLYEFEEGSGSEVLDTASDGAPLDLTIEDSNAISWINGGLSIGAPTVIQSATSAAKVTSAIKASGEVTIEAWLSVDNSAQAGPSRIVSLSVDSGSRNVTLGQVAAQYDVRLRSDDASINDNGTPSTRSDAGVDPSKKQHVVYTLNAAGLATLYIDGVAVTTNTIPGSLSNWDEAFPLMLGNELGGGRPWLGELYQVAIFDQALTASVVSARFAYGDTYAALPPTILPAEVLTPTVQPGGRLEIQYHWDAVPMADDYVMFVHFLDANNRLVFQNDHAPPARTSTWHGPTSWTRGRTVPATLAEGTYKIIVGLYESGNGPRQTLSMGAGVTHAGHKRYLIGTFEVMAELPTELPTVLPVEVLTPVVQPGDTLRIKYRWDAVPMADDYVMFVHFLDANNRLAFQNDHPPATRTSTWHGPTSWTRSRTVPVTLAEGTYKILVGLYESGNGPRQTLSTGAGVTDAGHKRYLIGTFEVTTTELPTVLPAEVLTPVVQPGDTVDIKYHWDAVPMANDYVMFVHFRDANNRLAFQNDHAPATRTSTWSGLTSWTRGRTVPATLAEGTYEIIVGLYQSGNGPRQSILAGSGVTEAGNFAYNVGSFSVTTTPIVIQIEVEDFREGGNGVAYFDSTPGNSGGQHRGEDVDIISNDGGLAVNNVASREWLTFDINVPVAGEYEVDFRFARGGSSSSTVHFELNDVDISGPVEVGPSANWGTYETQALPRLSLPAGQHVLKLFYDDGGINTNWFRLTLAEGPPPSSVPQVEPAPGKVDASTSSKITASFDAFNVSNMGSVNLTVKDQAADAFIDGAVTTQGSEISFSPSISLMNNRVYEVHATGSFLQYTGTIASTDYKWTFKTINPEVPNDPVITYCKDFNNDPIEDYYHDLTTNNSTVKDRWSAPGVTIGHASNRNSRIEGYMSTADQDGDRVLKLTFPAQWTRGVSNDGPDVSIHIPRDDEYYVSYRIKLAPGFFRDGPEGTKLPGFKGLGNVPANTGNCPPPEGKALTSRIALYNYRDSNVDSYVYHADKSNMCGDNFTWRDSSGNKIMLEENRWYHMELRTKLNSNIDVKDGIVEGWLDGVKLSSRNNLRFRTSDPGSAGMSLKINKISFILGMRENAPDGKDDYMYMDNFRISKTRVGPTVGALQCAG